MTGGGGPQPFLNNILEFVLQLKKIKENLSQRSRLVFQFPVAKPVNVQSDQPQGFSSVCRLRPYSLARIL